MSTWTRKERFDAILSGELADRPIVSGWKHFLDHEQTGEDLAKITVRSTKKFDWDWVKINPRATYYTEVWGNTYDFEDYNWVFPKQTKAAIERPEDLFNIQAVDATKSAPLLEQIQAVKQIRGGLPDTPLTQTIFSPLTILLFLAGRMPYLNQTVYGSDKPMMLEELFLEERTGVHKALHAIALTLADYVKELKEAGIDGLFYAVTGTPHPSLFHEAAFNEFSRPYDLIVLEAARESGGKTILHTCGDYAQPKRFDEYPVHGISWDTKGRGNCGLDICLEKTKVGGVDHHLFAKNDLAAIRKEAATALKKMEGKPFILAPNCAIPPNVTDDALMEFRRSVG
ncbi:MULTISPECIES: uroporphyrinogen decarboxylase family protein [Bacillaceae]|uniref:Uroporphyrinogen-III decarboxylase n=1 Tax=Evansella alkalicola TaxID=745819 RepID=A0ABS6JSP2_9BACI|nr:MULTISPECIES: uroporphyrinogen decarboxylase family protein [Bacillaceae]MBU9721586.1 uroporphyrinogen-III decarboxylase [Bacillus alkalicola]